MIKFDLHIHSNASSYKEGKGVVEQSTLENVDVLLEKLDKFNVALFSITDHNRFNLPLYEKISKILRETPEKYANIKGLLAGAEFDVKLDDAMGKCHIITVFDTDNEISNYKCIDTAISKDKLQNRSDFYSRDRYELLLKDIGLNVILIACQRSGLNIKDENHNSLSDASCNPEDLLSIGYIDALEFQKPNVEGILRDNLKVVPRQVGLVMGSDCHDWAQYPYHDKGSQNKSFIHSRAKILPTFKGLLMAMTSPETRINCQENNNTNYIRQLNINGITIPLANGINAIIGENGSGKSTVLKMMAGNVKETYVRKIIESNSMSATYIDSGQVQYIGQGDIVDKFSKSALFPDANFNRVDNTEFTKTYEDFACAIIGNINQAITANEAKSKIANKEIIYNPIVEEQNHFITINIDGNYGNVDNPHSKSLIEFRKIENSLKDINNKPYYRKYNKKLEDMISTAEAILKDITKNSDQKDTEKEIKNYIISASNQYGRTINNASSSLERDKNDYKEKRNDFINLIVNAAELNSGMRELLKNPEPIKGFSSNLKNGFRFNCDTKYNNKDVIDEFYLKVFNKNYASYTEICKINTKDEFAQAVRNCNDTAKAQEQYDKNVHAFIDEQCKCSRYIVDSNNGNLGNTLGEMSLAFFKYQTEYAEKNIFLIDQPEDNISNNNISKRLLDYFNSIRYKAQIVIVTHNPLLVVNQDVDQVIFLKKIGDNISTIYGCLEYESDEASILDLIANNMDGGRNSIEKRLKVYGKENNIENE